MKWVETIPTSQLPADSHRVVRVSGKALLLIHYQGDIFAIENACPHWGFPLNRGKILDDYTIQCPFHRSAFDFRSGDVKVWSPWPPGFGPLVRNIRRKNVLPIFPTRVENDLIYVGVEERSQVLR